jgi:membrane protease YdiL (CAAX protease family)
MINGYINAQIYTPIVFALPHWEGGLHNVLATYVCALFFALLFLITKNLWPLIVGHIYTDYVWFNG